MPATNSQQTGIVAADFYQPSEVVRMFSDFLAKNGTGGRLIRLRGLYFANVGSQPWNGLVYDRMQDPTTSEDIPIRIPVNLRNSLKNGSMVEAVGVVERRITTHSNIQLSLAVTRIETVEATVVSDRDRQLSELWQTKSTRMKNVDAAIETLLHQSRRPRIALLLPTASIAMKDFDAAKGDAAAKIDFEEVRSSFANVNELKSRLGQLDKAGYTAIAIIRGGGTTDATDETAVLAVVAAMQTPLICAVGHEADEHFIKRLADKTVITPTALGTYFRDMIERVDKAVSQSEAALRNKIKTEYEKRLAEASKHNEEINKRLAEASKQVAELTKLQAEATKQTQQMNVQLAETNKNLQQMTKQHTDATHTIDQLNRQLADAQDNAARITKRAIAAVVLAIIIAVIALIL